MNWFYTTKSQTQAGPVDEAALAELHRSGAISGESLVWREGMEGWKPYSDVFPAGPSAMTSPNSSPCAECGGIFPPDQLISLGGRLVCGGCKPAAVQKLQEGVISFGSPADPEELWRQVEGRGFDFTISSVLARSWTMVKANFWPNVGVTLLAYLIMMGAGQIPLIGLLANFFVQPQMMAGLNWYFLRQFRGETATLNDTFVGFRRGFGQMALYMLILFLVVIAIAVVAVIPVVLVGSAFRGPHGEGASPALLVGFGLGIPALLAIWYLVMGWIFVPLLIFEKGLKATAAMKLSRQVVHLRFWKIFGLLFTVGLLCVLGLFALIIGVVFVLPVAFAALSRLYEDAFGERDRGTTV